MPWEVVVWIVLIATAFAFQLRSVVAGSKWGMLTSSVRWLRTRMWGRILLFPPLAWLTWHWFLESATLRDSLWDDAAAIILGLVAAIIVDYQDYKTTYEESDM